MFVINSECTTGMVDHITDNSIDAIVTDPPYGLSKEPDIAEVLKHWLNGDDYIHKGGGFMGKKWDSFVPGPSIWREAFRCLKPGGYALVFAGSRTQDLMTTALRLAGFEIRDVSMWLYGSGFPKSLNVGKAVPEFDGWGTALKPAYEPIIIARKPLMGTVAENVLKYGTGAINIDGCRVDADTTIRHNSYPSSFYMVGKIGEIQPTQELFITGSDKGRWPANIMHDGSPEVVDLFPNKAGAASKVKGDEPSAASNGDITGQRERVEGQFHNDKGSAARFFYCPKTSKADRNAGCDQFDHNTAGECTDRNEGSAGLDNPRAGAGRTSGAKNIHPTVKPTELMRYLCRLVTQPGGLILDPFAGSGSTGRGAVLEGFNFIGFEMDNQYCDIANARIMDALNKFYIDGVDING